MRLFALTPSSATRKRGELAMQRTRYASLSHAVGLLHDSFLDARKKKRFIGLGYPLPQ